MELCPMRVGAQAAHPFPSLQAFLSVHFSPEMPPVFLMAFLPCVTNSWLSQLSYCNMLIDVLPISCGQKRGREAL